MLSKIDSKDIEYVIINDGSTDNTYSLLKNSGSVFLKVI